MKQWI